MLNNFIITHFNDKSRNLRTVSSGYFLNFLVRAERGVEQAKIGWSGAVSRRCRKTMKRSGRSRSGNRVESGVYRNRLERGAAFSPLTLSCSVRKLWIPTWLYTIRLEQATCYKRCTTFLICDCVTSVRHLFI